MLKIDNLYWQTEDFKKMNWYEAKNYCKKLSLHNTNGWRLPTIEEIQTILTKELTQVNIPYYEWVKKIKEPSYENINGDFYFVIKEILNNLPIQDENEVTKFWTSIYDNYEALTVDFRYADIHLSEFKEENFVIAVKDVRF